MRVKLTYADGRVEKVTIKPVSTVMSERTHKPGFIEEHPMEHAYWTTWHTLGSPGDFDAWLEKDLGADIEIDEDDDAADPAAPSSGM